MFVNRLQAINPSDPPTTKRYTEGVYVAERLSLILIQVLNSSEGSRRRVPLRQRDIGFELLFARHGDFGTVLNRPPVWIQLIIDCHDLPLRFPVRDGFVAEVERRIKDEDLFRGSAFNGRPEIQLDVIFVDGSTGKI